MNTQRVLLIAAALLGALSNFLPWISTPLRSFSGADIEGSDGWFAMAMCLASLAAIIPGQRHATLSGAQRVVVLLLGLAVAGLCVADIADMKDRIGDSPLISLGIGLYLMTASGLGLAVLAMAFPKSVRPAMPFGLPPPPPSAASWTPCPRCGSALEFVPTYQRWYCRTCAQYA